MYYWINKRRVDLEHLIKKKDKLEDTGTDNDG